MFYKTVLRTFGLLYRIVVPAKFPGFFRYFQRVIVLLAALPAFMAFQLMHWLGFALDEILFRGYRAIEIKAPVFVLGAPRSGTTFMHRLLAHDPAFTTFATWECLFAPSISERYFWIGIAAVDQRVGSPLRRLLNWVEERSLKWSHDVHPISLSAPEEDYLVFLPILCCFILVVPFPDAQWLWRMGRFDQDIDEDEQRALIRWYRRCLQRHMYVHGSDRMFLSKNAAFAGMAHSLVQAFPDCRIVVCERDALRVIDSQFRSLAGLLRLFGLSTDDPVFVNRLVDCFEFYYENLDRLKAGMTNDRLVVAPLWESSSEPRGVMTRIFRTLDRELPDEVLVAIQAYENNRKPARSLVDSTLHRWGLDEAALGLQFTRWRDDQSRQV